MAQYTTQSEIEATVEDVMLAQLADDRQTIISTAAETTTSLALAATQANITQMIEKASNRIDTELLGHVDLTNATILARIQPLATDIALYYLWLRRYTGTRDNPWETEYTQALKTLKDIRERKNRLAIDPDRPDSQVSSSTSNSTRKISSDTLSRYV